MGFGMTCKHCKAEIPIRAKGRGRKRTDFCSDPCKNAFRGQAFKEGSKVLVRRKARSEKPARAARYRPASLAHPAWSDFADALTEARNLGLCEA